MSTIDERIVRMVFDNKKFESGVSATMGTLRKLKDALTFKNVNLNSVKNAISSVSFDPLNKGVTIVQERFSFLGEFVKNVFDRISNKIIDTSSLLLRELSVEPIKAGFEEYETQMNSIQTIMANTQAAFADATTEEHLQAVNDALDELNRYADLTIYNFTEMTRNIGTFTAAGVDLNTAKSAIQGIANLAAVSGSTSLQASTAMYQLSQAIAAGAVKLQDWNSVVNAGMGGQVFQDALKRTARESGVAIDEIIEKAGSFRNSLYEGWITSEVLTDTLKKMTDVGLAEYFAEVTGKEQEWVKSEIDSITSLQDRTDAIETLAEALAETGNITKEDAKSYLDLMYTAQDAATKVKTFSQLVDTVKEGLGSGWTQSMEYIIGDFEEAKEIWTDVYNVIDSIITPMANARNEMLKFWHDNGGREAAIKAIATAWEGVRAIMDAISKAFHEVFPSMTGERLLEITKRVGEMAESFNKLATSSQVLENIRSFFISIFRVLQTLFRVVRNVLTGLSAIIGTVFEAFGEIFPSALEKTMSCIESLSEAFRDFAISSTTLARVREICLDLFSTLESVFKAFLAVARGVIAIFTSVILSPAFSSGIKTIAQRVEELANAFGAFATSSQTLSTVADIVSQVFGTILDIIDVAVTALRGLLAIIGVAIPFIRSTVDTVVGHLKTLAETFSDIVQSSDTLNALESTFMSVFSAINSVLDAFIDIWESVVTVFIAIVPSLGTIVASVASKIRDLVSSFKSLATSSRTLEVIRSICDALTEALDDLMVAVEALWDGVSAILGAIGEAFIEAFPVTVSGVITGISSSIQGLAESFRDFATSSDTLSKVKDIFTDLFRTIQSAARVLLNVGQGLKAIFGAIFDAFVEALPSSIGEAILNITDRVEGLSESFRDFATSSDTLSKVKDIFVEIFTSIASVFRSIKNVGQSLATVLGALIEALGTVFQVSVFSAIDSVEELTERLRDFITAAETVDKVKGAFVKVFDAIVTAFRSVRNVWQGVTAIFGVLIEALGTVLPRSMGNAVIGVEGLTQRFRDFLTSADTLSRAKAIFTDVFGAIASVMRSVLYVGQGVVSLLSAVLLAPSTSSGISSLATQVEGLALAFRSFATSANTVARVREVMANVFGVIQNLFTAALTAWDGIKNIFSALMPGSSLSGVLLYFSELIVGVAATFRDFVSSSSTLSTIATVISTVVTTLSNRLSAELSMLNGLFTVFQTALPYISSLATGLSGTLVNLTNGLVGFITSSESLTKVQAICSAVFDAVTGLVESAINVFVGISSVVSTVTSALESHFGISLSGIIRNVSALVQDLSVSFRDFASSTETIDRIKSICEAVFGAIESLMRSAQNMWTGVKGLFSAFAGAFGEVFQVTASDVVTSIATGIENLTTSFSEFATSSENLNKVKDIFKDVFETIKNIADTGMSLWNGVKAIFSTILDSLDLSALQPDISAISGMVMDAASSFEAFATSSETLDTVKEVCSDVTEYLGRFGGAVSSIASDVAPMLKPAFDILADIFADIKERLIGARDAGDAFEVILTALHNVLDTVLGSLESFAGSVHEFAEAHAEFPILDALRTGLHDLLDTLSNVMSSVKTFFGNTFRGIGVRLGFISDASDELAAVGESVEESTESVSVLDNILKAIKTFAEMLEPVVDAIVQIATRIIDVIPEVFAVLGSADLKAVIDNMNALFTGGLILSLKDFVDVLKNKNLDEAKQGLLTIFNTIRGQFDKTIEYVLVMLERVTGVLTAMQRSVNANALLKLAIAIGLMSLALAGLATLEMDTVVNGLFALGGALYILAKAWKMLGGGADMTNVEDFGSALGSNISNMMRSSSITTQLIKMAIAVDLLTVGIKALAGLDMEEIARGLIGIGVIMFELAEFSKLAKGGDISSSVKGVIGLAIGVRILASSVNALSGLNWDQLTTGLAGVGILLLEIATYSQYVDKSGLSIGTATSVLLLSAAIKVLEGSVTNFASMDWGKLEAGLVGVGLLLLEIATYSQYVDNSGLTIRSAINVLLLSAAIKVLEGSVTNFASMSWDSLLQGLIGVGLLMVYIYGLSSQIASSGITLEAALSVGTLTQAITILSEVVQKLGDMTNLYKGLIGLGASIVILVGALKILGDATERMLMGAAGMLAVSIAMRLLVPAIKALAELPWYAVFGAILELVGALVAMGEVSVFLAPFAASMLTASVVIAAFGAASVVAGAGLLVLASGITALAGAFLAVAGSLAVSATMIKDIITGVIVGVVNGVVLSIVEIIKAIIKGIDDIIIVLGPALHNLGDFLIDQIPYICKVVGVILIALLDMLTAFIPDVCQSAVELVFSLLGTLIMTAADLLDGLIKLLVAILTGLADGIRNNAEIILAAIRDILSSIIELILIAIAEIARLIPGVGNDLANLVLGAKDVVRQSLAPESFNRAATQAVKGADQGFTDSIKDLLENSTTGLSAAKEAFGDEGQSNLQSYLDGFNEEDLAKASGIDIASLQQTGLVSSLDGFDSSGNLNIESYLSGFNATDLASSSGIDIASLQQEGLTSVLGGFDSAGDLNLQSYLDGFNATDLASSSGLDFASLQQEALSSTPMDFTSSGDFNIASYLEGFSNNSDAFDSGSLLAGTNIEGLGSLEDLYAETGFSNASSYFNQFTATNTVDTTFDNAQYMASSGVGGADSLTSLYEQLGVNAGIGYGKGLNSEEVITQIQGSATNLAQTTLDTLGNELVINSPSRKTMKLGNYTAEGYAIGIRQLSNVVKRESASLSDTTIDTFAGSFDQIRDLINSDFDIDPTIRPVLDLAEIQNGAKQIDGIISSQNRSKVVSGLDVGNYARNIFNGMNVDAGKLTVQGFDEIAATQAALERLQLESSMQDLADSQRIDYQLMAREIIRGMAESGYKIELNDREVGRVVMGVMSSSV